MKRKLLGMIVLAAALPGADAAHAENFVLAFAATPSDGAKAELTELGQALYRKLGPGDGRRLRRDASAEVARGEVPTKPSIATNRNLKAQGDQQPVRQNLGLYRCRRHAPKAMPATWRRRAF